MCDENGETYGEELYAMSLADIEEAAELVAAAEREACAKVCEKFGYDHHHGVITDQIAAAIRARGQA
jgi:hypothetical protein